MSSMVHTTAGPKRVSVNGRTYRYCPVTARLQILVHEDWWLATVCAPSYADIDAAKAALS